MIIQVVTELREGSLLQGESGIDARFLKLSPSLTVSPIMTNSITPTPPATQYWYPFAGKIKGPSTG